MFRQGRSNSQPRASHSGLGRFVFQIPLQRALRRFSERAMKSCHTSTHTLHGNLTSAFLSVALVMLAGLTCWGLPSCQLIDARLPPHHKFIIPKLFSYYLIVILTIGKMLTCPFINKAKKIHVSYFSWWGSDCPFLIHQRSTGANVSTKHMLHLFYLNVILVHL